jgi:carbamoyltransferase
LLEKFLQKTRVPVLLNTSFNVANEPIVESPEDAIRCFLSTGIDGLLIGDYLLVKDAKRDPA